jgi:arsenate reductase-like glutaredoxin family protein
MIKLYTLLSNNSSRRAVQYCKDNHIPFEEILMSKQFSLNDVILMVSRVDDIYDLLSNKSHARPGFDTLVADPNTTMMQVYEYILANPKVLRAPIVISHLETQVGYTEEELGTFIPRHLKKQTYSQLLAEIQKNQTPDVLLDPEPELEEEEFAC